MSKISSNRVTQADVAKAAGVSVATVSLALSGRRPVSASTKRTVMRIARELGYSPDYMAQGLRLGKTHTLGLLVGTLLNPFYAEMAEAAGKEAMRRDYHVALYNAANEELTSEQIRWLGQVRSRVDGFLITTASLNDDGVARLHELGKPVVLVNRTVDSPRLDSVSADNREGMERLARYLVGLGHRRIGYLAGPKHSSASRDRLEGYLRIMAEERLDSGLVAYGDLSVGSGLLGGRELLKGSPTAIIAGNDLMAFGVLHAAHAEEVSVPTELSVAGFDDIEYSGLAGIDLTTVRANWGQVATHAVGLLVDRLSSGTSEPPRRVLIPAELVIRGTTRSPGSH